MEIHQSSNHYDYLSFLPGDPNTRRAQLFSLGPQLCKYTLKCALSRLSIVIFFSLSMPH